MLPLYFLHLSSNFYNTMESTPMKHLLLFVLAGLPLCLLAQQGEIWYFGAKAGLDFSSGSPALLTDGAIETFEGCAVYSDSLGNLLFYTNGGGRIPAQSGQSPGIIWNRNHEIMYDMRGEEGGGFSARQSSLIIPKPGAASRYLLFTMEEQEFDVGGAVDGQPQGRGLSYFEIDMSLNGGLGEVVLADQRLQVPLFEALSGTIHENGEDYWILAADNTEGNNRFVRLLVNADGVQEPEFVPVDSSRSIGGSIKISPNTEWLYSSSSLFRFDNSTGAIEDPAVQLFDQGDVARAYAFSPNSRYFYAIERQADNTFELQQYDLEAADIPGSQTVFATLPGELVVGQMQVAPDGNLYFLDSDFFNIERPRLSAILCPNTANPSLQLDAVQLPIVEGSFYVPYFGLPNFTDHLFARQDSTPTVELGADTLVLCEGETPSIGIAPFPGLTYEWSTGAATPSIEIDAVGTYALTVTNDCGADADTVVVQEAPEELSVSIEGPAGICPGGTATLEATGIGGEPFIWSTADTARAIVVDEAGTYEVSVQGSCDPSQTASAAITLEALSEPEVQIRPENGSEAGEFCQGEPAILEAIGQTDEAFSWSTGSTDDILEIEEESPDSVVVLTGLNACGADTDTLELSFIDCDTVLCGIQMPNTFTPNGDGANDEFGFVSDCEEPEFQLYEFSVYNRWGNLVFEADEPGEVWDGTDDGEPAPSEVYYYYFNYQVREQEAPAVLQGDVSLLR